MNTKTFISMLFVLAILFSCKTKAQCDMYADALNKVIESEYNQNLNKNRELFKREKISVEPLVDYTKFNNCERKSKLFIYPKDSVIVLDRIRFDDYAGMNTNLTGVYVGNEMISYNAFNKGSKTIKIDKDYILNNNHYNYVLKLKKGQFSNKSLSEFPSCALKDITFVTLIVNQKISSIYRVCSNELIKIN
ncbi:hypothetical protein ATE47_12400 [Chryseobacterium sp. IHB B 17019]|uniref:hypothetical protein n=1 Tax=Chryseobacterium sp. IHB B 17019 TaxID=1721091 RepID=UPI00071F15D9|nr:hypothetical protein [Chryseobacterium sp. IHB B 17019]ALR31273.1 hypothetical protein ATE47_12400 [Chryseobacterium sp. IHB B 17019]